MALFLLWEIDAKMEMVIVHSRGFAVFHNKTICKQGTDGPGGDDLVFLIDGLGFLNDVATGSKLEVL